MRVAGQPRECTAHLCAKRWSHGRRKFLQLSASAQRCYHPMPCNLCLPYRYARIAQLRSTREGRENEAGLAPTPRLLYSRAAFASTVRVRTYCPPISACPIDIGVHGLPSDHLCLHSCCKCARIAGRSLLVLYLRANRIFSDRLFSFQKPCTQYSHSHPL